MELKAFLLPLGSYPLKIRKLLFVLSVIALSGCSALPYRIVIINNMARPGENNLQDGLQTPGECGLCTEGNCPEEGCEAPDRPSKTAQAPVDNPSSPSKTTPVTQTAFPTPTNKAMISKTVSPGLEIPVDVKPTRPINTPTPVGTVTTTSTMTPVHTATSVEKKMQYKTQLSSPAYMQNLAHPELGCNWLGVAGQVFDRGGMPAPNIVVVIEGTLNGTQVDLVGITGLPGLYAPGGYEIPFGNEAIDSANSLKITLYDLNGSVLSETYTFSTFADCSRNLIVINFQEQ